MVPRMTGELRCWTKRMFLLVLAALVGGAITFATLSHYGVFFALGGAPVGGSLAAAIAAIVLALRSPSHAEEPQNRASDDLDQMDRRTEADGATWTAASQ